MRLLSSLRELFNLSRWSVPFLRKKAYSLVGMERGREGGGVRGRGKGGGERKDQVNSIGFKPDGRRERGSERARVQVVM